MSGEIVVSVPLPFESPVGSFGAGRGVDGFMYVATVANSKSPFRVFNLARLSADNVPDLSYGSNGVAEVSFDGIRVEQGVAMVWQADGGVMLIADYKDTGSGPAALFAKLDSSGQLDLRFGDAGKVVHYFPSYLSVVQTPQSGHQESNSLDWRSRTAAGAGGAGGVVLKVSERLLYFYHGYSGISGFLAAFKLDGQVDIAFGSEGVVVMKPSKPVMGIYINGVLESAGGEVIAYGSLHYGGMRGGGFIARFLATGQPDLTFGDKGYVFIDTVHEFPTPYPEHVERIDIESVVEGAESSLACSGYIVFSPSKNSGGSHGIVARFDKSGAALSGFNQGSPVVFSLPNRVPHFDGVALQDDKVVAGGRSSHVGAMPYRIQYLVARFNVDGSRDLTFADQGYVEGDIEQGFSDLSMLLMDSGLITAIISSTDHPTTPTHQRLNFVQFAV